jgi:phosphatidylethanolamine/phosphatidyl-N-methylethanolamine N-methyltransferase
MNSERRIFMTEYLRHPLRTAAILPSSPKVAKHMAAAVPPQGEPVVVELGPGTGAFTGEIQRRLGGRGRQLAVELNSRFAAQLSDSFPGVEVCVGDGLQLRQILDEYGLAYADVIISGLPHALFSQTVQRQFMDTFRRCLAPDGRLVAHAYVHAAWSPPARHFHRLLRSGFGELAVGKVHWTNIPPVFVYVASRMHQPHREPADRSGTGARR